MNRNRPAGPKSDKALNSDGTRTKHASADRSGDSQTKLTTTKSSNTSQEANGCKRTANSSSKFNRILSNLERSIMSQFSSSNYQSTNKRQSPASKSKQKASSSAVLQLRSQKNGVATSTPVAAASTTNDGKLRNHHHNQIKLQPEQGKEDLISIGAISGSKASATTGCKSTNLNKYQQQIVSTLNRKPLVVESVASSSSSIKLSIPPPHANSELKNEHQRQLLGQLDNSSQIKQGEQQEVTFDQLKSKDDSSFQMNYQNNINKNLRKGIQNFIASSSSPASSAKSLPTIQHRAASKFESQNFNKYHQQQQQLTNNQQSVFDEDESGFSTYQSRRNLIQQQQQQQQNQAMLLMPRQQPYVMNQSINYNLQQQQQNLMNHYQQQQQIIGSNNLSNQVPIIPQQQHQPQQQLDLNLVYNFQRPNQFEQNDSKFNIYSNGPSHTDQQQQIYANAPPKPRRYQYYDYQQQFFQQPNPMQQTFKYMQQQQPIFQQAKTHQVPTQTMFNYVPQHQDDFNKQVNFTTSHNSASALMQPTLRQVNLMQPVPLARSKSNLHESNPTRYNQPEAMLQNHRAPMFNSQIINQIRPSTMTLNRTQARAINYQQIPQPTMNQQLSNLQRSRSVTHLLHQDYEPFAFNMTPIATEPGIKFLQPAVSSSSTTNMNLIGLMKQHQSQQQQHNMVIKTQQQFINRSTATSQQHNFEPSIQHQQFVPRQQRTVINNWSNNQTAPLTNLSLPAPAPTSNNGNKLIMHQQQQQKQRQNQNDELSLDDKIRYLLIEANTNGNGYCADNLNNGSKPDNNQQQTDIACSGFVRQQTLNESKPTVGFQDKSQISQHQNEFSVVRPLTTTLSNLNLSSTSALTGPVFANHQQQRIHLNADSVAPETMGNRQYQVNRSESLIFKERNNNDCNNSQLIVDLTTPRVLAKTQTTLMPSTSVNNLNSVTQEKTWRSMNQLGLPTRPTPIVSVPDETDNYLKTRSHAPYYYSDLKSEEQKLALLNIVQQKSLSPPPKLLSRSIDQSNTRLLATKSATLHSSQAKVLSENLFLKAKQNGHKEIDIRGFNVDYKSDSLTRHSMLDLNDCKDSNEVVSCLAASSSLYAEQQQQLKEKQQQQQEKLNKDRIQLELLDQESCKLNKQFSKSKSLDNISQKSGVGNTDLIVVTNETSEQNKLSKLKFGNTNPFISKDLCHSELTADHVGAHDEDNCDSSLDSSKHPDSVNSGRVDKFSPNHNNNDEDDFIEFLSTDNSSHRSSQFEASQFSVSDFTTSSSSSSSQLHNTSSSSSNSDSTSGFNDSLNSPLSSSATAITKPSKPNGKSTNQSTSVINSTGILKNNGNNVSNNNNNNIDMNKFKNVLGNVIDVDTCSINNLSQCSPVNSASNNHHLQSASSTCR